jgi:DNA-binding transcriptional LysR family regulator
MNGRPLAALPERNRVNLRQLEIFGAVMSTGTTMAAAQLLNMSQPAVSNAIMQLERNLDVPLFNRVKGRLQPTEDAELLYRKSLEVFSSFEAARAIAGQLRERSIGHLRVAVTPSPGNSLMPLAVKAFLQNRPNIRVSLIVGSVEKVLDLVAKEEVNLGFYYLTTDHPLLISEPLATFDMVCALPADHRLAGAESVHAADLRGETLISYSTNERLATVVESAFGADGCDHRPMVEVRFVHSACELVAQGLGVAVVDAFMVLRADVYRTIVLKPFRPRTTLPVYVCERRDRARSALSSLFLDEVKCLASEHIRTGVFSGRMHTPDG